MTKLIYIIGLIIAWLLFYKILTARKVRLPKIKTTIIVLLFSAFIYGFSYNLYAFIDRIVFSFDKDGEVALVNSPFKIPSEGDVSYCQQFTDQDGHVITTISTRRDGRYCGEFWHFKRKKKLLLPYKNLNEKQTIYWASPTLRIIINK
ncbi:hypothetical protein [Legionella jamestowniensis]|uniref:Transmembrane protein n=1 Tax=Legionella jamestowniensis TaxID=455 RepID=A0A0W0UZZ9_9GAMM|nr:hypothetical protein [Legionella jamestowniensis]KTD13245.1 hypothetical protein Ljam_0035 [Legionella jamestowniensis]SFL78163.1 hypothetical protein SAMN02746073_1893 [Legionella jamestowniensis DSM 19215]